ncbi:MAG: hypothetical protein PVG94_03000 [Gammaproteobacteria bacterium]|jgi:hypothetical protein
MERCFTMTTVKSFILLCLGTILCINSATAEHQLVLVADASSPLQHLNSLELRKIYLGFPVKRDGKLVKGLRNTHDEQLNEIFLQTVVAMSEKSYTRMLLSRALRHGIPRPAEFDDPDNLLNALSSNPYSVTYVWKETADRTSNVKILGILWQHD